MNILIMGCSFGVPAQYPNCIATDHSEHQLRSFGHTVYNVSQCGGGNINSLIRAKKFLAGESIVCPQVPVNKPDEFEPHQTLVESFEVDWIVWFHTELIRDCPDLEVNSINRVSHVVYSQYFNFAKSLNAKLAVIGGAGPVHPVLYTYGNPDFCIDSWFNEILNLDLPQIQTLSKPDMIDQLQGIGRQSKLNILEQHLTILKALDDSEYFPDNYNPGNRPHRELAIRLHKRFAE
jgi:hypothetical protein